MSDALERLKNRNRPTVPQRDASLTPSAVPPLTPSLGTSISGYPDIEVPNMASPAPTETAPPSRQRSRRSAAQNTPTSDTPVAPTPETPAASMVEVPDLDSLVSRYLDIPTSTEPGAGVPFVTKQSTVRFEQGMSDRLQALTRQQGLCREALLEAMFDYCEAHPQVMQTVLEISRSKQDLRQQAANQKRAQSMMQRFQ